MVFTESKMQVFDHAALFAGLMAKAIRHYKVPACAIALQAPGGMKLRARIGIENDFIPQASDGTDPMCYHHAGIDRPIIIEDTSRCMRVQNDVMVKGEPFVRFYAGSPLKDGNSVFGTLCIFDWTPRALTMENSKMLSQLADEISEIFVKLMKDSSQGAVSKLSLQDALDPKVLSDCESQACLSLSDTEDEDVPESDRQSERKADTSTNVKLPESCGEDLPEEKHPEAGKGKSESRKFDLVTTAAESDLLGSDSMVDSDSSSSLCPPLTARSHTWQSCCHDSTPSAYGWSRTGWLLTSIAGAATHLQMRSLTEGDQPSKGPQQVAEDLRAVCTKQSSAKCSKLQQVPKSQYGEDLQTEAYPEAGKGKPDSMKRDTTGSTAAADGPLGSDSLTDSDSSARQALSRQRSQLASAAEHLQKLSLTDGDRPWEDSQQAARSKPQPEMSLLEFLHRHELQAYLPTLEEEEIDMQSLPLLSDQDLKSLGIKMGPRRIIQAVFASQAEGSSRQL
mmetsp:Transcript_102108/g.181353  ORF Transcript_102108/g.181353 Transcript_102108/m.181353 type:complete len:507 (-) Transcript_102108:257-1777(-)|eukprot:CAMPEP_0197622680 /NCGR_PEP_ID=MMETSP1338-20131121/2879_1 /TAXON_ID=43686 ORGANISM="Pelagodinium beii, Strain RCC1491" /NCGR_SAMPLE_ID=MMETSP1338 /ASSEMBLY_ACC=CAM_ASM_000754 /LENGTH=506 /DNA_ID=CAMNT_0043192427 /DNA_START=57 /DNA_END=1577 /DNA_ORIENTATION=-